MSPCSLTAMADSESENHTGRRRKLTWCGEVVGLRVDKVSRHELRIERQSRLCEARQLVDDTLTLLIFICRTPTDDQIMFQAAEESAQDEPGP